MLYTQLPSWIGLCKLINFCLTLAVLDLASPSSGQFVYVVNEFSNDVSAFEINAMTGLLTPVPGSPFAAGMSPHYVAVDSTGRFTYVTNSFNPSISEYTINPATGALTPVPGSPLSAPVLQGECGLDVDPTGRFVYTANGASNSVSGYAIDASSGALSPVQGSPFPAGVADFTLAVDPSGKFVYAANNVNVGSPPPPGSVSGYTINSTTGALKSIVGSPFAAGVGPFSVVVDPTGRFVYVGNFNFSNVPTPGSISGYRIDASTGVLSPIPGSPFAIPNKFGTSLAIDPSGKFVYVTVNQTIFGAGGVLAYAIDATTGALTLIQGSPFPFGTTVQDAGPIAVEPAGKFAYLVDGGSPFTGEGSQVIAYSINSATGALTFIPGSPIAVGLEGFSIAITPPAHPMLSVSLTPNSGSGTSQTFAFQYSDSHGFGSLTNAYAGFGATAYGDQHTCRVEYYPGRSRLFLKDDGGTAFIGPVTPGVAGTLSNSQCTLDAGASSVSGSGEILTLNLAFSFTSAFAGKQGIFMYAIDRSGVKTPGRQDVGTWTVP